VVIRAKLAKGAIWIASARALSNLISLATTVALARVLAPSDFGLVAIATSVMIVLNAVTELSLAASLVQHRSPTAEHYHTAWTLGLIRSALVAAVGCALAWPMATLYREPRLTGVMLALGLGALLSGLANPRAQMLTKDLIFWQQFMLQVSQKVVSLGIAVSIGVLFHSYWALIWGTLAGQLAGAAISFAVLPYWPRFSLRQHRDILKFSIWMSLYQVANTVNWRFDQLLMGGMVGRSALGYFGVAETLAVIPTREATAPITTILFPGFSRLAGEPQRLAGAYQSAQALVTAIALPAGIGMALIANPLIRLTLGPKWLPSVFPVQVLASVFALQTLGTLSQPLAMAAGETKLIFYRSIQTLVVRIPLILAGALLGGVSGIIWARAAAGSIEILFHLLVVRRVAGLSMTRQLQVNVRSLISTAAMAAVLMTLRLHMRSSPLGLAVEVAVRTLAGAATYVVTDLAAWRLSGRPDGPESEVINAVRAALRRLLGAPDHPSQSTVSVTLDPS